MPKKLCWKTTLAAFPITLVQSGIDKFEVGYGMQRDLDLSYAEATAKLGESIMHALACEGNLDNRMKGEK